MSKTRHPLDFITDRLFTSLMNKMVSCRLRRMLICVEHIGYIVKFPGVDDKDTSMTLAMNRLNISSPRSVKKRPNHLYSPYSPAKRRCSSDPTASRSSHLSQAQTVPLRHLGVQSNFFWSYIYICMHLKREAGTLPIGHPQTIRTKTKCSPE